MSKKEKKEPLLCEILSKHIKKQGMSIYSICKNTPLQITQVNKFLRCNSNISAENFRLICKNAGLKIVLEPIETDEQV